MNWRRFVLLGLGLLGLGLVIMACGPASPTQTPAPPCPTAKPCPDCPQPTECPKPVVENVPYEKQWAGSSHADKTATAFNDWNDADPKEVPATCAKCHSTPGFLDFLGADGSAAGKVDKGAPIGTVITCEACHNDAAAKLTSVVFPSGLEVTGLGPEARCMQCHQGRESTVSVNAAIDKLNLASVDTVTTTLGFRNVHYLAASATQYGTQVKGGYEYEGKAYDVKFAHVEGLDTCTGCHDQHTLKLRIEECKVCHSNVNTEEDLKNIRMNGSAVDYDGDGNVTEGIYYEIASLRETLYTAIQAYGQEVSGKPIAYSADAYPYWYIDPNGDGTLSSDEITTTNRYDGWTPRLLKAAYNYQFSVKDPGAFAHGGKYVIELLYDSTGDLNNKIAKPVDMSMMHRIDAGHFASSEMPFRDWDGEGEVPATCVKCHSAVGLPMFLKNGATIAAKPASGFLCTTCHDEANFPARYEVKTVKFPSGATVDSGDPDTNLCINCHQGRESTVSINSAVKDLEEDAVAASLRFRNVHYFAAGATLFGGDVQGAYQYPDQTYVGRNLHVAGFDGCIKCHDTHGLTVKVEACSGCHEGIKTVEDLKKIRMSSTDYDGDGSTTEGVADEIATYYEKLYAAIQAYAKDVAGSSIAYSGSSYPYFFADTNGNGVVDPDEAKSDNSYKAWTPRLLKAAYNYQYVTKDPGAFAHNSKYIIQVLYDSLTDLGKKVTVDMKGMTRP